MTHRVFIDNPYLKEIDSKIIKSEFKDNKSYIQLDKTIFYPHLSGGQPRDLGTINDLEVIDVYEEGNSIIHVIKGEIKTNRVHLIIDWDRRFDIMQQHTGQHLLSSSFYRLFNAKTVGFHMGSEYITIDISRPFLTEEESKQVEYLANKVIQSNFKVKSYFVDQGQLSKLPLRKETNIDSQDIRILEIDSIDYSPCCGTHVSSTGEIGLIKIRRTEKYKSGIRVEFVCGSRAINDYTWKNDYINKIGRLLSSKDVDILDKVNQLYNSKDNLDKENRYLREELFNLKGELLLNKSVVKDGIKYIIKDFKDMEPKELSLIASNLNKKHEKLIQIYSIKNKEMGQFLITRSMDLDLNLKDILNEVSNKVIIKGGGNQQMIQGTSCLAILDNVMNMFKGILKIN